MAKIKNGITNREYLLLPVHLFGRYALYPYTSLKGENISRQHALITWDGTHWLLEDTSANGTFLNTVRIQKGQKKRLEQADNINFGSYDSWEITDLTAPKCMLIPTNSGNDIIELTPSESLTIPGHEKYSVFSLESGEWVFKTEQTLAILKHGSKVGGQHHTWTYVDARPDSSTLKYINQNDSSEADQTLSFLVEDKAEPNDHIPSLEELRQASLDISLFLYCHGMARQTSKKVSGSIIKPLCRKDGSRPFGSVDINVWKAWLAGEVKFPQTDKLEYFSHYLLKEFPIIQQWANVNRTIPPSLPLTTADKRQLVQAAANLRQHPQRALAIWQQQHGAHGIALKLNALPGEARHRACFEWLNHSEKLEHFSVSN